jgi:hypothetical protein
MTSTLARPWLRLPHLLAIYFVIAVGGPCAFFIIYELVALLRSSEALPDHFVSPVALLACVVITFLIIPYIYRQLTQKKDKRETFYSPELVTELTGSLIASLSFGLYLREQSTYAQMHEQMLKQMRFMIENAEYLSLSDEHLENLQALLEHPRSDADSEYRALLTRFLEKYQETHQDDQS